MTIAISIDEYIYKADGQFYADNVGFDIVKRYADCFETVHLIARVKQVALFDLGMHNKPLPFTNVNYYEAPFFNSLSELCNCYSAIKDCAKKAIEGCQVALVRLPSWNGSIALHQLKGKIPYALEVVANPYEQFHRYGGMQKVRAYVVHRIVKHYCKSASSIAFVTKQSQQKIYEINKNKEDNTYYSSIELKKSFFSDVAIKNDFFDNKTIPLRITHVSNMISGELKGHREVLQVAAKLTNTWREVSVTFAGDGPDVNYYKRLAEELGLAGKVNFVGFIDRDQLHDLLINTDIFLFPSKSEGMPKVLIEAMSVSVPCISSKVGGIPELLPEENIFECLDVDGMTNRIIELASDKKIYVDNAKLMYQTALEFESNVLAKRRVKFYECVKNI